MGHAGAIISGGKGTAAEKMSVMKKAGIHVVESPAAIGSTLLKALGTKATRRTVATKGSGGRASASRSTQAAGKRAVARKKEVAGRKTVARKKAR